MDKKLPVRKNIRLKDYDYSQNGAYFITICTQDRLKIFGEVFVGAGLVPARVKLNNAGKMIERVYLETMSSFNDVIFNNYAIMPNHFHCIISIQRAETSSAPTSVNNIVQVFKSKTTVDYINGVKLGLYPPFNKRLWQRNYYDCIIRNEEEYRAMWQYIDENPARWTEDCYYTK